MAGLILSKIELYLKYKHLADYIVLSLSIPDAWAQKLHLAFIDNFAFGVNVFWKKCLRWIDPKIYNNKMNEWNEKYHNKNLMNCFTVVLSNVDDYSVLISADWLISFNFWLTVIFVDGIKSTSEKIRLSFDLFMRNNTRISTLSFKSLIHNDTLNDINRRKQCIETNSRKICFKIKSMYLKR